MPTRLRNKQPHPRIRSNRLKVAAAPASYCAKTKALLPSTLPRVEIPAHHFVIIHRTSGPRDQTREFAHQLVAEIGPGPHWERKEWDFAQLMNPETRRATLLSAARANVVLIAIDDQVQFTESFETWMEEWSNHVFDQRPVLIALAPHRLTEVTRNNRRFLETLSELFGLTFLFSVDRFIVEHRPESRDSLPNCAV